MRQVKRAVAGELDFGFFGRNSGVHFGVSFLVVRLLRLTPVRLVAMRDAQGGESALEDNLRVRAGIAENMNQILAVTFLADVAHARGNSSWIEQELSCAGGAQEIEKLIGLCSIAHEAILSVRPCRCGGRAAKWLPRSIRHSGQLPNVVFGRCHVS